MTARNGSAEWHGNVQDGAGTVIVGNGVFQGAYSEVQKSGVRIRRPGVVDRAFESTRQGVPMTDVPSQLTWDVYVTAEEPIVTDDLAPGATERRWPPISATLISAERDAVLVDPLMTAAQARGLGDWIAASGKNLTAVFVTHGHGDHWFGLSVILDRFPGCRAFAVPSVVEKMRLGSTPEYLAAFWNPRLPGKIADRIVLADPLPGHTIELEGHQLVAVELGHTDMDTTMLSHATTAVASYLARRMRGVGLGPTPGLRMKCTGTSST